MQNKCCCCAARSGVESREVRVGRSFVRSQVVQAGVRVGLKPNLEGGGRCATEFGRWKAGGWRGGVCGVGVGVGVGTVAIKVRQSLIRADQGDDSNTPVTVTAEQSKAQQSSATANCKGRCNAVQRG